MQIPIIGTRGQIKPYGSIPWINWKHPLANGLISYCYDVGSGPIDLVTGSVRTIVNTANPPFGGSRPSKYGTGLRSAGGSGTGGPPCTLLGGTRFENFFVTAPYSFACGFMVTATPSSGSTPILFSVCDATVNTPCKIGPASGGTDDFFLSYGNNTSVATATGLLKINQYQTVLGVAPIGGTTSSTYVDGILRLSKSAIFTTNSAVTGSKPVFYGQRSTAVSQTFATGFVYYSAIWDNRALSASEARWLHDDPYCFLIYPEDEMFASLVGATTGPFQWYQMNDIGLPELPIIRPPLDIVGY